jgi:putative modified peptide
MNEAAVSHVAAVTENFVDAGGSLAPATINRYVLSKQSALRLLQKLSTDDSFRAEYMANPRETLLGIGVSSSELPSTMPALEALAGKAAFAQSLAQVEANLANVHACLIPPHVRLLNNP